MEKIIIITVNDQNVLTHIILGEFGYLYRLSVHWSVEIFQTNWTLISQVINYYIYRNSDELKFMSIFEMLSGLRSSQVIGFAKPNDILKCVK